MKFRRIDSLPPYVFAEINGRSLEARIGFGPSGDDHVRFALVENEQRVAQAVRGIKKALDRL